MRWLPVIPVLLGLLFTTTAHSSNLAGKTLLTQLDHCINQQFRQGQASTRDTTLNIKARCSALYAQRQHPLITSLQPPLAEESSLGQLIDIRALIATMTRPHGSTINVSVDNDQLASLVSQYYVPPEKIEKQPDLWDRILEWLREMLIKQHEQSPDWLKNYLGNIDWPEPDTLILILKIGIALLVLLVLLTVFNELRAANVLAAWRHHRRFAKKPERQPDSQFATASLDQDPAMLADKAFVSQVLLKTLMVLMYHRVLPEKFSLTNQELLDRSQNRDPDLLTALRRLFQEADSVLYGDVEYSPQQRQQLQVLMESILQRARSVP